MQAGEVTQEYNYMVEMKQLKKITELNKMYSITITNTTRELNGSQQR